MPVGFDFFVHLLLDLVGHGEIVSFFFVGWITAESKVGWHFERYIPELTFRKGRCLGMHSSSGWSCGFNYQMIWEGTKQMLWKLPHVSKYHFWQIEHDRTKCSWLYPCMWGLHDAKWGPGWRFLDRKWSFEPSVGFISTLGSNFRRVPCSKLT